MSRWIVPAALVLALTASVVAHAQDAFEETVRRQLRAVGERWEKEGFTLANELKIGSLDRGSEVTLDLDLQIARTYYIAGACDQDCTDLDLILLNGNGDQIDSDVLGDDVPIVDTTVARSGRFRLTVRMVTCSANPCRYGVGVFSK